MKPEWNMDFVEDESLRPFAGLIAPLANVASLGLWKWDINTNVVKYSNQLKRLLGYENDELPDRGEARFDVIYSKDVPRREILLQELLAGEKNHFACEERAVRKDGSLFWVQEHFAVVEHNPDGTAALIVSLVNDISDVKWAAEHQRAETEHWQNMAHMAGLAGWIWDIENDYMEFNQEFEELLGYPVEKMNGSLAYTAWMLPAGQFKKIEKAFNEYISSGGDIPFAMEMQAIPCNGESIWLHCIANIVERDKDGRPLVMRGGVLNIDQRVKAEQKLREALEEKEYYNQRLQKEVEKAVSRLAIVQNTSTTMFEANPYINLLFNDKHQLIDCNPAAISFFGFADKEDFLEHFIYMLQVSLPERQPDGTLTVSIDEQLRRTEKEGNISVEVSLNLQGKITPLHAVFKRIPYENTFGTVIYIIDMSDMFQVTEELNMQSNLLSCINGVATKLLVSDPDNYVETVYESMRKICEIVEADRMYIWENKVKEKEPCYRRLFEWSVIEKADSGEEDTEWIRYKEAPSWHRMVEQGEIINKTVDDITTEEREILFRKETQSLIVIPIIMQGKAWGFVGLEDFHKKRILSQREVATLRSGAIILVSGLLRNAALQNLLVAQYDLKKQEYLLRGVNAVAECLMSSMDNNTFDEIQNALETLSESVGTDRSYVWKNIIKDDRFCCIEMAHWFSDNPPDLRENQNPIILDYDRCFPNWQERFQTHFCIYRENISSSILDIPRSKNVKTILIIPIILEGEFWGFVSFDDIKKKRVFMENEIQILRSGGMLVASAIMRSEMTESLIEAREDALSSMKAKSEFLSRMSHEIRTPMNAIIGMTTVAQKARSEEKVKYCLDKIDGSSRQLLNIINDVLDMSKIDADKFEILLEEFDFERMMENVFNVIQVKMNEKHQEFEFEFDHIFTRKVVSDELRLNQVLTNLLSNAVKFTPDYGHITVKTHVDPIDIDNARLRITVSDTGIGISQDHIEKLFASFEQGDGSITREYGGTGLGLSICKKIIELMGGRIWVESIEGEGSHFIFEIDIRWGTHLKTKVSAKSIREDLNILVVDDMPDVLEYFETILDSFQLKCDVTTNGYEALEMVEQSIQDGKLYDLIFIDWHMPEINGIETAKRIREITNDDTIVIMISAIEWNEIQKEAQEIKLYHFLPKPILPSALFNKLIEVTSKKEEKIVNVIQDDIVYDWSDKHILLVEDIEINQEIVLSILEDTNIQVDVANDGQEGVDRAEANSGKYDLIFMDVQMPRLDGLGATKKIRMLDGQWAKEVPIIAMTANAFKEDAQACMEAGMNDHLPKPLDVATLFGILKRYLS